MSDATERQLETYVTTKWNAEQQTIRENSELKMAGLPRMGIGNGAYSKYSDERHIRLHAERVKELVSKRAEIRMEACELYGLPLDDRIIADAKDLLEIIVSATANSAGGQLALEVMRGVRDSQHANAIAANFKRELASRTQYVLNEIICSVERRRITNEHARESGSTVVVHGDNARVNICSIDNSQNTVER